MKFWVRVGESDIGCGKWKPDSIMQEDPLGFLSWDHKITIVEAHIFHEQSYLLE